VHENGLEGYYRIKDAVIAPVDQAVFEPRDYQWLSELQKSAETQTNSGAKTASATLEVQGISCAGCVWLIERLFNQQPGALSIETDAQLGRMLLRWQAGAFDAPQFARVLQSYNYLVGSPGEEPAVPESRLLVRRIGLCAAFAMNVMLFTLPVYFGMAPDFPYARLFGTLSFVFATLSLLAGGGFFLSRAWRSLRGGVMHIDLPIAVGIVGSYLGSAWGWATHQEGLIYFDFVATFILLMLTGRWAQVAAVERNRRRLLQAHARPSKVGILRREGVMDEPVESLRPGDVYLVRSGQVVPVDSRLESSAATMGTAWISGEADPRSCRAGERLPGGAVNLGRGEVRLRALAAWEGSLLSRLLAPIARDGYRHRFLERVISGYLVAIFGIAAATGLGWWFVSHDATQTWAAVTAVLVVSCPCAIGLAFPLADEMAAVAARRFGVFVREADLWPRLARIHRLVFDKTGTLTLETPALRNPGALARLAPPARAALAALVRDNPHPVAQALHQRLACDPAFVTYYITNHGSAPEVVEEPGYGVSFEGNDGRWSLGRPGWGRGSPPVCNPLDYKQRDGHDTEFCCDGVVLARFRFADAVRPDAVAEIAAFRAAGKEVFILSGDRQAKVDVMARDLGLPLAHAVGAATPEHKAAWLRARDRRDTLMLGDGANDSLAFDAAFARGTPVIHRGVLAAKADFYYLGRGIGGLRKLFALNRARRRTQAALLFFSVAYNLLAVGLAAFGHMNPLLAAILMPVSSLLTLAIVVGGMRKWLKV